MQARLFLAVALLTLGVTTGCGNSGPVMVPVTGTVTYQGKEVTSGEIIFRPVGDPSAQTAGGRIVDGKYSIQATSGKKKVEITARRDVQGSDLSKQYQASGEGGAASEQYIPAKYNTSSTLEEEVGTSKTELNFTLE